MVLSLLNASQINNNYLVLREAYSKLDGFSSIFKKFRQFFNTKKEIFVLNLLKKVKTECNEYLDLTQEYLRKPTALKICFKLHMDINNNLMH